jgi:MFS family permease
MFAPLSNPVCRHLFAAQALSLLGTGLATVALGLLAFELAGADAGLVLGTALAIKMVCHVGVAPIAGAFAHLLPRRRLLVALDLVRAAVVVLLPFVTETWQVYVLIALLQTGSAAVTPSFQATIPDVLPAEAEYARTLSLARLAYDLENLASPMVTAVLLGVMGFSWLFAGTALGFLASAALVASVALPSPRPPDLAEGAWARITRGSRIDLATPRLHGLLAVNMSVVAAGAMVIVNTVVIVRGGFGLDDRALALTLAAHGGGFMLAALMLPHVPERVADRAVIPAGAGVLVLGMAAGLMVQGWGAMLVLWAWLGLGNGLALTLAGRLRCRSAEVGDRPALLAAQFALSHACWLGASAGIAATYATLAALAMLGVALAAAVWPRDAAAEIEHAGLPPDHPHRRGEAVPSGPGRSRHRRPIVMHREHPRWPCPVS